MNALILILFTLILLGGFCAFLVLEAVALWNAQDEIHTFSTYIKNWRRRKYPVARGIALSLVIWGTAIYLWGHLVMEWW